MSTDVPGNASATCRVELFGGLKVICGNREVRCFPARRVAALLARLAANQTHSVAREELIDLFWGEMEVDSARHNLRQTLFSLRRALSCPSVVCADHDKIWLDSKAIATDLEEFDQAIQAAKNAPRTEAIELLTHAAELYRGDLLAGMYDEWLMTERRRVEAAYLSALADLQRLLMQADAPMRAAQYALRVVAANPYEEEAHLTVMQLFAAAQRPDLVERQLSELRRILRDDLAIDPSQVTEARAARIFEGCLPLSPIGEQTLTPPPTQHPGASSLPPTGRLRYFVGGTAAILVLACTLIYTNRLTASAFTSSVDSTFQQMALLRDDHAASGAAHHAELCLSLGEQAWSAWYGPDEARWVQRLEAAHDDVRLALRWFLEKEPNKAVQLAGAMTRFWYIQDLRREGYRWLTEALQKSSDGRSEAQARALIGRAFLAEGHGAEQDELCRQALEIYRQCGSQWGIAHSERHLGFFASERQDHDSALAHFERALSLFHQLGDERGEAVTLLCLGFMASAPMDVPAIAEASAWGKRSLELFERVGNKWGISMALRQQATMANLKKRGPEAESLFLAAMRTDTPARPSLGESETRGFIELLRGRFIASQPFYAKALALAKDQGDLPNAARLLDHYVNEYMILGQDRSARLLGASHALDRRLGARQDAHRSALRERQIQLLRGSMEPARFDLAYHDGEAMSWPDAVDEVVRSAPQQLQ